MIHLVVPAFIAGLLMFFAPCTLPLVPGYLAFIGGADPSVVKGDLADASVRAQKIRRRVFMHGVWYVLGFSLVFILMGSIAGFFGSILDGTIRLWLMRIGGIWVTVFGLHMLGVIHIKQFDTQWSVLEKDNRSYGSFVLGASFAFGWTPCIGPLLASVLFLASTGTTVLQGMFLLGVFSLGMAIPYLILAWSIGSAYEKVSAIQKHMPAITRLGGIFLIILGLLLFMNQLGVFLFWGNGLFIQFY